MPRRRLSSQKWWNGQVSVLVRWMPNGWKKRSPGRSQFSNEMDSLKVAAVARMNSRSSIPIRWWKVRRGGAVDSPTPIVPICSDSTSVMSSRSANCCASSAAAAQPAVPPPAITTLRI
jgi:hypothetical protein